MSGIVLSASVRQNLLSLQSTADLLSTTQNRLATGNKVNTALDNPTNFFTAQGLNNRASDINNLLDSIGNGVQVLQAANTGITSIQKLVDSAKSIANQALQATSGYTTKSQATTAAITGATAGNLLGAAGGASDATYTGPAVTNAKTAAVAPSAGTETGTTALTLVGGGAAGLASVLTGVAGGVDLSALNGKSITVGSQTITFDATASATATVGSTTTIGIKNDTASSLGDILNAITTAAGGGATSSINGSGNITLTSGTTSDIVFTGADAAAVLGALGLSGANITHNAGTGAGTANLSGATLLSGVAAGSDTAVATAFTTGQTITVNGQTLTFSNTDPTATTASGGTISLSGTVQDVLAAIDKITGATTPSSISAGGAVSIHTGTASALSITSSNGAALDALGLGTGGAGVTQALTPATGGLSGTTLNIGAVSGGTALSIQFGTGGGQVSTLDELNTALAKNNMTAALGSDGKLTFTTTNDYASTDLSQIASLFSGDAQGASSPLGTLAVTGPAPDANAQNTRATLISQYNTVMDQIKTTAQDASFNGINLLNGDQLKLVFNESGKSTLNIQGVTFDPAGLGISKLTSGTDFLDNAGTNKVLEQLNNASSTLRSQASTLGSNLSIVQIRQDFSKNLINVLQTGSSNLTLADTNEEAANSQALSTRQSIAVSALALANQSQQSVLQLLR